MHPQLPPPDPNERLGAAPEGFELSEPAMCFPLGEPSRRAEQLANAILELRPGALFVFDTR
jgi:hypothetical protein